METGIFFIAVDIENGTGLLSSDSLDVRSQLGVAVLDTRDFASTKDYCPEEFISTHQFITGTPQYQTRESYQFLFGRAKKIKRQDMMSKLESLFVRSRRIALVGHGFESDRHVLQRLEVDLKGSVITTFDTRIFASEVLSPLRDGSLRGILEALQCPFNNLHSAGNDANFTLRCLLLLAEKSCATMIESRRAKMLHAIAHSEIPTKVIPPTKSEKNREDKLKRLQKSRRFQSRTWDQEIIDQIRAERALKRQALDGQALN